MNTAIRHSARPSDSVPKGNFGGMPAEAIAMVRRPIRVMHPRPFFLLPFLVGLFNSTPSLSSSPPRLF